MACHAVDLILPSQEVLSFPSLVFIILTVVLGLLVALLLSVPFMKELGKKKIQHSEKIMGGNNRMIVNDWDGVEEDGIYYVGGAAKQTTSLYRKMQKERKKADLEMDAVTYRNETDTTMDRDEGEAGDENNELLVFSYNGIVSILSRSGHSTKARDRAMEELCVQDIRDTWILQAETQKEKSHIFVSSLRILLGKFVASERISESYVNELLRQYEQKIEEKGESIASELVQLEEELRQSGIDNLKLEEELEMKRPEYSRRMAAVVDSVSQELRDELLKNSGLDESEIDALYEKLFKYMTMTEKMISEEVEEQTVVLQDRLTKRQALAQQYADLTAREQKETQTRVSEMRNVLQHGVEDQKMTHMQMEGIIKDYQDGLAAANEQYKREMERQSRDLMKKLKDHRDAAMAKLRDKQAKEEEKFEEAAPLAVNPSDVVQAHHDLRQQHRNESNEMIDELDYTEAEAMSVLRKKLAEKQKEEVEMLGEKIIETLTEETRMSEKEAQKIMKKHQSNCAANEEQLAREKQYQSDMLQKKIQERKDAWEKEKETEKAEQEQLAKQQERTVTKVLDSQTGLEDEARKRIMLQHEQNTAALQNHLQLTRVRQQKLLEAKLARQKARMESLKEQQLKEAAAATDDNEDEENIRIQQDEELATEMSEFHKEHQKTVALFRTRIALETSEMLKTQDEQMGALLGRLQVGQARRRGVIERQDKAIKELQEKLVDTVGDNSKVSEKKTEKIIQRHIREVEEVEEKMRKAREHQARVLQDKYEAQKLMREKTLLAQMEVSKTAQEQAKRKQTTGKKRKRTALEILSQIYEDNKQEQAMKQMEQEMKSEMMQQKQEMDRLLEEAMKKELEEREKDFLGDLAAIGEIRKEQLNELVTSAVEDSGGDERDAKDIKKDILKRYKSAKARSDADDNSPDEQSPKRKRKGKGKKKK